MAWKGELVEVVLQVLVVYLVPILVIYEMMVLLGDALYMVKVS